MDPFHRPLKDVVVAVGPIALVVFAVLFGLYKFANPAPPKHFVISTGEEGSDYQIYAKLYKDIIKKDGIDLEIRSSKGAWENLHRMEDPNSGVDAGFVEDGLGTTQKAPDVSALGSLYYEPIWVFYTGKNNFNRFSHLKGKNIAIGEKGGGTHSLAVRILRESGVDKDNTHFLEVDTEASATALKNGQADAAIFLATPDDKLIVSLIKDKSLKLMSVDQAEAITRKIPFLHHLILPHGVIDLKENIPDHDIDLTAATSTLLVRDSLHPALVYLLLKAASQVHSDPGILERKNEFPVDKDYQFRLNDNAKNFYKTGTPFWQRYLPFWLAILVDRFILLVIPALALIIPVFKLVPKILEWRLKSRFYDRYGELKSLEDQITPDFKNENYADYLNRLDKIEDRVNKMKVPLDFSDNIYHLREHIHFVRERLARFQEKDHIKRSAAR